MRRPVLAVATAVLGAALALSGCGSEPEATTDAGSTSSSSPARATPSPSPLSGAEALQAVNQATADQQSVQFFLSTSGAGQEITGTGSLQQDGKSFLLGMTMGLPGTGELETVVTPEAFYLKPPPEAGLPPGKTWVKFSADGKDQISKAFGAAIGQVRDSVDPRQGFAALQKTATVSEGVPDTVDGLEMTKYVVTVDLRKAAALASAELRQQYRVLRRSGVKTVTSTMWVDQAQLPYRLVSDIPVGGSSVSTSVTYTKWGEPVDIAVPPPAQVTTPDQIKG